MNNIAANDLQPLDEGDELDAQDKLYDALDRAEAIYAMAREEIVPEDAEAELEERLAALQKEFDAKWGLTEFARKVEEAKAAIDTYATGDEEAV